MYTCYFQHAKLKPRVEIAVCFLLNTPESLTTLVQNKRILNHGVAQNLKWNFGLENHEGNVNLMVR